MLGIGNILLQDEGFGVRVVEELERRYHFPDTVKLLDGGTLGLNLLGFISETDKLIIIDAVDAQSMPGTFFQFDGAAVQTYLHEKVSLHELGVKEILIHLELSGKKAEEVVIIGVQPQSLDLGLELTALIGSKVERSINAVISQLQGWGVEVKERLLYS